MNSEKFERLRGYIYGYANRFRQYGSLTKSEAAALSKSAKEILKLGGDNHYRFAQKILTANSNALS